MPRKPVPAERIKALRTRFRLIIDHIFDGHLSMAAKGLEMPFSTVQQYYQKGPRRYDAAVVERIRSLLGIEPAWLLGEIGSDENYPFTVRIHRLEDGSHLGYPAVLAWRVEPIIERLSEGRSRPDAWLRFFESWISSVREGEVEDAHLVTDVMVPPHRMDEHAEELRRLGKRRADIIHNLCEHWEFKLAPWSSEDAGEPE